MTKGFTVYFNMSKLQIFNNPFHTKYGLLIYNFSNISRKLFLNNTKFSQDLRKKRYKIK